MSTVWDIVQAIGHVGSISAAVYLVWHLRRTPAR